jgi:predicted enzyme related to lactoylglutathione lyase
MPVESVSAILFYSSEPARLARFYSTHLGIPFELDRHGAIREHMEADIGDVHLAVLKGRGPDSHGGGVSPTFRVEGLDAFVKALRDAGTEPLRPVLELDQGKRVASFLDPDGNMFNLIEIVR